MGTEYRPGKLRLYAVIAAVVVLAIHIVFGALLTISDTGVRNVGALDQLSIMLIGVVIAGAILLFTGPGSASGLPEYRYAIWSPSDCSNGIGCGPELSGVGFVGTSGTARRRASRCWRCAPPTVIGPSRPWTASATSTPSIAVGSSY